MNRIYKVIYSKVRQCYVVVSEIAKSHGRHTKSSVAKSSAALTAGVLIALGSFSFEGMPVVQADGIIPDDGSVRNNDFVGANDYYWYYDEKEKDENKKWKTYQYKATDIFNNRSRHGLPNYQGAGAKLPGAITAGLYAQAGQQTVTIGDRNAGESKGSVFIGEHSGYNDGANNLAKGGSNNYVTSVGFQSDATGWGSIAIGSNAKAENSKTDKWVVKEDGHYNTSGTVDDDTYSIEAKPTIEGASVALGYNAHSKDGNIAIGANSDATSTDKGDSYVSVGNGTLKRRITNVAKGTDNSDVVTVGQMNDAIKQADNLNVNAGWGINVADENDPTNTGKGTKNVISLKHNLGTGYNDDEAKGMIIGGLVEGRDPAKQYGAADANSVIVGAGKALASGKSSVVVGGLDNVASGATSVVIGGDNNNAAGNQSAVFGGRDNKAVGVASTASGGIMNAAVGQQATAIGGSNNYVLGANATAVGGLGRDYANGEVVYDSAIRGSSSVGIAGGSTGENAIGALAAGHQAVVTTENGTAIGYQATTDEANTIAFGHDADDVSGYIIKWKQLPDGQINADNTTNDYTQAPESVTENTYTKAAYNRLVKVADGQKAHDAVVMEQLKPYTKSDASNIGNYLKTYTVGDDGETITEADATDDQKKTNKDDWGKALGSASFTAGTTATATDASTSDQLVTGKTLYNYDKPTGSTNYVNANNTTGQNLSALDAQVKANADELNKPNRNIKYYSVKDSSLTVDGYTNENNDGAKGRGSLAAGFVTHADGIASTVVGSYSGVMNTGTALGPLGRDYRGATAVSLGTVNVNNNTDTSKPYSGVANSIVGQANMTTNSNAAIIYGAGNTVTDSYRPIDPTKAWAILGSVSDPKELSKAMQDAVKDSGGQVMVMGGGNTVDKAYMTQVTGVGNTVKGNQVESKGEWVTDTSNTAIKYDPKKSSQYNYVDGFNNEVINGKHDYVIGANNKLSGDSYDDDQANPIKRSNKSNIVIGDNHTLTRKQNTVIIGSSDTENTQTIARDAVIIGHNANATSNTGADNAVAIGLSATATGGNAVTIGEHTSAGDNSITIGSESSAISGSNIAIGRYARVYGTKVTNAVALGHNANAKVADGVAIGSNSIATVAGNSVEGYDPTTGQTSKDTTATWQATNAAVSIGTADGKVTRQINGVAAGTNDTDAVNVAQLKKLGDNTVQYDLHTANKGKIALAGQDGTTITNVKSALDGAKDANGKDATIATATGDALKNAANLGDLQNVYNDISAKADKASTSHTALTVEGNTPAGKGKDEKTKEDVYAGKNILLHESTDENGKVTYDLKLAKDINIGKPGKDGEDGKIGIDGKDGHIGLNGSDGITVRGLDGKDGTPGKDGVTITGPKGEAGKDGIDGKVGISGTDGKDAVSISGKDGVGHIGLTGPAGTNGKDGASIDITVKNGYDGKAGTDGKDGVKGEKGVDGTSLTRIVYEDATGEHQVATMEDGLKFKGDDRKEIAKKLNNTLDIIGGADSKNLTEGNIGVNSTKDGQLKVQLAKDLTDITSISNQKTEGGKTTGAKITLGDDGSVDVNGGKITNVGSGIEKDENNKYTVTEQNQGNAANIGDVQNMVNDAKTELTDGANGLNNKANIDASNIGANLKHADGSVASADDQKANAEKWGSAIGTGEIKADDGRMVTGKTVYDEVRPKEDGNYVKKDETTGKNLSALDSKIGKLDETKKYNYIDSGKDVSISNNLTKLDTQVKKNADDITNINQSISTLDQNAVKYDDSNKSKVTLAGEGGTTITNVKDGALSENSSDAVNGKQLYAEQQAREKADAEINQKVTNNTNEITKIKNGDFTDASKTAIHNIAKNAVKVVDGKNTTVTTVDGTDTTPTTYAVNVEGTGEVASGDKGLISGDTIYNELRPSADGSYIKKDSTTANNLVSLDTQVKKTSDLINSDGKTIKIGGSDAATKIDVNGKDGKGRVITGVVSDANDPNSAANVGYVNGITAASNEQIYRDMNMQYNHVENDISRAAAGSNALAALHPMQEFDPDDKAQFALGYGHYRNSNAGAVGAFYQPDENSLFSFGVSFGNGDAGLNAGVTFKFGPGGSDHHALTKTQMAKVIDAQSKEIDELKKDNADKDKRIDALEQKMTEILAKLDKSKD